MLQVKKMLAAVGGWVEELHRESIGISLNSYSHKYTSSSSSAFAFLTQTEKTLHGMLGLLTLPPDLDIGSCCEMAEVRLLTPPTTCAHIQQEHAKLLLEMFPYESRVLYPSSTWDPNDRSPILDKV